MTYHRTTREAAENILGHGVEIERSRIGSFGQGFYTATHGAVLWLYGDTEIMTAVRTINPLEGHFNEIEREIDDIVDRLSPRDPRITPETARAIRHELLRIGYDGLVIRDAGGDGVDFVIALVAEMVKVIQP